MIVAAHAGTGKTAFSKLYPDQVVDFTIMPYKYYLDPSENPDDEANKANPNNEMHEDFPYNYVSTLKELLKEDDTKIYLIPPDSQVLAWLQFENIPYTLCYPQRGAKEVYRKRFLDRGNTDDFLEVFIEGWDKFINRFEKDTYGQHIVLEHYQFISDVIEVRT